MVVTSITLTLDFCCSHVEKMFSTTIFTTCTSKTNGDTMHGMVLFWRKNQVSVSKNKIENVHVADTFC